MSDFVKDAIKSRLEDYVRTVTQPSHSGLYNCPLCGSGTKKNKSGAFGLFENKTKWKCQSCNQTGDIFDLYGALEKVDDFKERIKGLGKLFNIDTTKKSVDITSRSASPVQSKPQQTNSKDESISYKDFFLSAQKNIDKTDYWQKRGLSEGTVKKFGIGFVPNWRSPTAIRNGKNAPESPRLIIPTSEYSYIARDTRPDSEITEKGKQYTKMKEGNLRLFNPEALDIPEPVFVVESELDALSIIEVGGNALALGGVGNYKAFLSMVKMKPPKKPIILALDDDKAGNETENEIASAIEKIGGILFYKAKPQRIDVPLSEKEVIKDANEALICNRELFEMSVREQIDYANELKTSEEQAIFEEYQSTATSNYIEWFKGEIDERIKTKEIATGFGQLDFLLDGGLHEGLYCIGAISSLGKTSFALQMCDQIARTGQDVLIFSLEMSRFELMARSISRITYEISKDERLRIQDYATSARGITSGSKNKTHSEGRRSVINRAIDEYSKFTGNVFISEGVGDIGANQIREAVTRHINLTGRKPVVLVDYMQILAPYNERYTDKQNTDKSVIELKRISRDYKIPVIAVSSFNRENYKSRVTMEAFKESGAIEYSADVLIGLQLQGVGENDFDVDEAKQRVPRQVELVILKNRQGQTGKTIPYEYNQVFNHFEESSPV